MAFPASPGRTFRTVFLLLAFFALLLLTTPVLAQGETAAAAPAAATDAETPNMFVFMISALGWIFAPLLFAVSICLVALIVLLVLDLRMTNAIPPGFVEEFTDTVNKRQFKQAFDLARAEPSFVGKVLTAGMSRLQYGLEDAREAANNMLESIRSSKEQLNNYTAVIGTLGPMLGLVGTVFGMIKAFIVLSVPGQTPNPQKLADGISHALVVTLFGIALSVPAIFFNTYFRNRIVRLTMDTGNIADDLLTQMYHNSKRAGIMPTPSSVSVPVAPAVPPTAK